ncbi:MAG: anthrone oxygenase family protein [Bacteroidota bacterium]
MNRTLGYIAILAIGAFAGNMINIGLSYGTHWMSLEPANFIASFNIDFPLLLGPTAATLMPALAATVLLSFRARKQPGLHKQWLYALGLLLLTIAITASYHLPTNLAFMEPGFDLAEVSGRLNLWMVLHWVRIVVALLAGVFALNGLRAMVANED